MHAQPTPEQCAEFDKLGTPERIDKMRAMHTQRMAAMNAQMDKRGEATKILYAALSLGQQKVFDTEHKKHGPHGGRGGPGHHSAADRPSPAERRPQGVVKRVPGSLGGSSEVNRGRALAGTHPYLFGLVRNHQNILKFNG